MADIRDKVMEKLNTDWDKMTRQQRRQWQRKSQKFEAKNNFTRQELSESNAAAYEFGKQIALMSAAKALKLGPVRIERIVDMIGQLEHEKLVKPLDVLENEKVNKGG